MTTEHSRLNALSGDRDDFFLAVRRAETAAADAILVRDDLRLWAVRLRPFFDREPHISVAEALKRYRASNASAFDERSSERFKK